MDSNEYGIAIADVEHTYARMYAEIDGRYSAVTQLAGKVRDCELAGAMNWRISKLEEIERKHNGTD